MLKLTATFKTITPLVLGGALPDEAAELRPPSLKGLLRYWYRAVDPGYAAAEPNIFGGSGAMHGQAVFSIALDRPRRDDESWDEDRVRENFSEGRGTGTVNGLAYLAYTLKLGGNDRRFLAPGTEFSLIVRVLRPMSEPKRHAVVASLWLLGHLGGVGTRSRRGFGATRLVRWTLPADFPGLPIAADANDAAEWASRVAKGLETIRSWFGQPHARADHAVLSKEARIYIYRDGFSSDQKVANWERALNAIGRDLQLYRRQNRQHDYDLVRNHLLAVSQRRARPDEALPPLPVGAAPRALVSSDIIERAAFGLPLAFRFSSLSAASRSAYLVPAGKRRKPFETQLTFEADGADRNASPLHLSAVEIRGQCHPLVVLTDAPLLRPVGRKRTTPALAAPPRRILEDFCDRIRSKCEEISL